MTTDPRARLLAGLVSDEADALYTRLLDAGELIVGDGIHDVDPGGAPAQELFAARIAFRAHTAEDRIQPVAHAIALQLLLARQHDEIMTGQRQVLTAWELLDGSLATFLSPTRSAAGLTGSLVELVSDPKKHERLVAELHRPSGGEVLRLIRAPSGAGQSVEPVAGSSAQVRTIYDSRLATDQIHAAAIEASSAAGEHARIRTTLPLSMILQTDHEVALVTLTDTAQRRSLLIRSPRFLAALRDWFELLWQDVATTSIDGRTADALSAAQRQVLRLLAAGLSDDAIARTAGVSVRTVRRHIAAVFDLLGVNSRFAAGVLAAKRRWI